MTIDTPLRLAFPKLGEDEVEAVRAVFATGFLTQGPVVEQFEGLVADYVGVDYAFAMSSCTTALHLSLVAMGIGPGDDVLVPAFTFPATANAVIGAGARPVLVDVDLDTYAVTVDTIDAAITPSTRAVMPVDPFGYPAPMNDIVEFATARGLRVVEDAACAIGASRDGAACGSFRDVGCFSFHPRKVITTGEGGMITTNDPAIAERIRVLRSHGARRSDDGLAFVEAGYNYRLSDVQGAIGVVQMGRLSHLLMLRRELALAYTARMREIDGVIPPVEEPGAVPSYQTYVPRLHDSIDRDAVIQALRDQGIEAAIGTYGLHLEPFFERALDVSAADYPNATDAARQSLALPLFPDINADDVDRVAEALAQVLPSAVR